MKIANTILGVVVVVILLMAVAIPIISDMQEQSAEPVYSDNATGSGKLMAKDTSLSLVLAKTESGVTAGGTAVAAGYTIVSSSLIAQVTEAGNLAMIYKAGGSVSMHTMANAGSTLTFSGSSWTLDSSTTADETTTDVDATATFTYVFHESATGKWLKTTAPVFADGGSTIYTYGFELSTGRLLASGTINGGLTPVFNYYNNSPSFTVSAEETDYTFTLNSIGLTTSGGGSATLTNVIVPVEYTSGYTENTLSSIIGIIPILLLTALIIGVVYRVIINKAGERDF